MLPEKPQEAFFQMLQRKKESEKIGPEIAAVLQGGIIPLSTVTLRVLSKTLARPRRTLRTNPQEVNIRAVQTRKTDNGRILFPG